MRRNRLSRTGKRRTALLPEQLKAKAALLRQAVPDNPKVTALCDAIEEMIAAGCTVREGGPEPRRWPLHEAWGGKEPPENS
jgi:hypothetical protein